LSSVRLILRLLGVKFECVNSFIRFVFVVIGICFFISTSFLVLTGDAKGLFWVEFPALWFKLIEWIDVKLLDEEESTELRRVPLEISRWVKLLLNVEFILGESFHSNSPSLNSSKSTLQSKAHGSDSVMVNLFYGCLLFNSGT